MKAYLFNVSVILKKQVMVEAESEKEAAERIKDAVFYGALVFDPDRDYHDTKTELVSETARPRDDFDSLRRSYRDFADDYIMADGERYEEA